MHLARPYRLTRQWTRSGFTNPRLEHEFQVGFRSLGVRFLSLGSILAAVSFSGFWLADALSGRHGLLDDIQLIRFTLIALFAVFALLVDQFKGFFARHYNTAATLLVCTATLASAYVAHFTQIQASTVSAYWTMTTTMVLATLMVYGFARLPARTTVWLGGFMLLSALALAPIGHVFDAPSFQRMAIHLLAANLLGYTIYRLSVGRERKLFLQSKRKSQVADLRRMKERAEAADRAKTAFLANMSHEIRTPMNGVIGALSMLNIDNLTERDRLFVKSARDSAKNLLQVLNEILDFAKLDAQKVRLTPAPFDPRDTMVAACEAFQAMALQKGVRIRCDLHGIPAEVMTLTADEGKLRQVLLNLVSNAVKFTQQGEVVLSAQVTTMPDANLARLLIDVSDTGVGIPESALDKLYRPFYQVETGSARSHGGTGLGLAICKQIIEEMGGHIQVRSAHGVGTTFEISLDVPYSRIKPADSQAHSSEQAFKDSVPPAEQELKLRGEVLLVEDNDVNAFIASMTLESLGVSCQHARNGEIAVQMVKDNAYDVILMDCEMPVMDGYQAVKLIRAMEAEDTARPRTPVVALTAHALTGDREACLQQGMDDYLTKPFDRQVLAQMLRQWLPCEEVAPAR